MADLPATSGAAAALDMQRALIEGRQSFAPKESPGVLIGTQPPVVQTQQKVVTFSIPTETTDGSSSMPPSTEPEDGPATPPIPDLPEAEAGVIETREEEELERRIVDAAVAEVMVRSRAEEQWWRAEIVRMSKALGSNLAHFDALSGQLEVLAGQVFLNKSSAQAQADQALPTKEHSSAHVQDSAFVEDISERVLNLEGQASSFRSSLAMTEMELRNAMSSLREEIIDGQSSSCKSLLGAAETEMRNAVNALREEFIEEHADSFKSSLAMAETEIMNAVNSLRAEFIERLESKQDNDSCQRAHDYFSERLDKLRAQVEAVDGERKLSADCLWDQVRTLSSAAVTSSQSEAETVVESSLSYVEMIAKLEAVEAKVGLLADKVNGELAAGTATQSNGAHFSDSCTTLRFKEMLPTLQASPPSDHSPVSMPLPCTASIVPTHVPSRPSSPPPASVMVACGNGPAVARSISPTASRSSSPAVQRQHSPVVPHVGSISFSQQLASVSVQQQQQASPLHFGMCATQPRVRESHSPQRTGRGGSAAFNGVILPAGDASLQQAPSPVPRRSMSPQARRWQLASATHLANAGASQRVMASPPKVVSSLPKVVRASAPPPVLVQGCQNRRATMPSMSQLCASTSSLPVASPPVEPAQGRAVPHKYDQYMSEIQRLRSMNSNLVEEVEVLDKALKVLQAPSSHLDDVVVSPNPSSAPTVTLQEAAQQHSQHSPHQLQMPDRAPSSVTSTPTEKQRHHLLRLGSTP